MARATKVAHPHTIRFPEDVYKEIKEVAAGDSRQFNNTVIRLLILGLKVHNQSKASEDAAIEEIANKQE